MQLQSEKITLTLSVQVRYIIKNNLLKWGRKFVNVLRENENQYIAFEKQGYVFAVPIENIDALIPVMRDTAYAVPSCAPNHILGVINPYGKLVTVINLLNLFGGDTIPETVNLVVILRNFDKLLGIPAQNAHIITAFSSELSDDKTTCTKIFTRDRTQYFVLDIPRLYEYIAHKI